jgi:hypothetical protein
MVGRRRGRGHRLTGHRGVLQRHGGLYSSGWAGGQPEAVVHMEVLSNRGTDKR